MMNFRKNSKLKALGLVEVLIVLAIIGVTMVGAMQLTTDSYRAIRDNEITDLASGFLLQGLEIAKSPQRVVLTDQFGQVTDVEGSYRLDISQTPPVLFKVNDETTNLLNNCDQDFRVEISQEIAGVTPSICLQIAIINADPEGFRVTSHIYYSTREGDLMKTLYGFRAEDFIL